MGLVTATTIGAACGVSHRVVSVLAKAGHIPFKVVDGKMLFDHAMAVPAMLYRLRFKTCSKCGLELPVERFRSHKMKSGSEWPADDCDECHKAYNRALRERAATKAGRQYRTREEIRDLRKAAKAAKASKAAKEANDREAKKARIRSATRLVCASCGEEKPRAAFHKSRLDSYCVICKSCDKKRDRAKYERIKADPKAWARRLSDPMRRLRNRVGTQMRSALLRNGIGKDPGVFRYLGYTVEELRRHLERTFVKGMSWDNMSEWHIDHIVPLSSFKFSSMEDQDFKRCWALSNLRACWAEENLSKGAKVLFLL